MSELDQLAKKVIECCNRIEALERRVWQLPPDVVVADADAIPNPLAEAALEMMAEHDAKQPSAAETREWWLVERASVGPFGESGVAYRTEEQAEHACAASQRPIRVTADDAPAVDMVIDDPAVIEAVEREMERQATPEPRKPRTVWLIENEWGWLQEAASGDEDNADEFREIPRDANGVEIPTTPSPPVEPRHWVRCPECNGAGQLDGMTCETCVGAGMVIVGDVPDVDVIQDSERVGRIPAEREVERLQRENTRLKAKYDKLIYEIGDLRVAMDGMRAENAKLTRSLTAAGLQTIADREEIERLEKDVDDEQNQRLNAEAEIARHLRTPMVPFDEAERLRAEVARLTTQAQQWSLEAVIRRDALNELQAYHDRREAEDRAADEAFDRVVANLPPIKDGPGAFDKLRQAVGMERGSIAQTLDAAVDRINKLTSRLAVYEGMVEAQAKNNLRHWGRENGMPPGALNCNMDIYCARHCIEMAGEVG